jgi:hypothetical protein
MTITTVGGDIMLLTRDQFREAVFARDNKRCVMCGDLGVDAHHITERRLFDDGGYYVDNGATLCAKHHLQAEQTILTCEAIREAAGITALVLPSHFYPDDRTDKWGNVYLPNGQRMRGELFYDESVQRALAPVLSEFTTRVKYPRTWHLPWSPGATSDDRVLENTSHFWNREVVVTTKMDGECTTMYPDFLHARSIDSRNHPSRNWVKNLHGSIGYLIPSGWRICGENLFAKHSIKYDSLPSYFMAFSIWNDANVCWSWDATVEWCKLIGIEHVPVIWRGTFDAVKIMECYQPGQEGYVVRVADEFRFSEFRKSVAKYVRESHVQTHGHWMRQAVERNGLA